MEGGAADRNSVPARYLSVLGSSGYARTVEGFRPHYSVRLS